MSIISKLATKSILCTWEFYRNRDGHKVVGITPHYMAAHWTASRCAEYFRTNGIENSVNYCIGYDGSCVCNVPEEHAAWTSSSYSNDCTHITIEIGGSANDVAVIPEAALEKFKQLATDIALRYGIKKYVYTGKAGANFTIHKMFAATPCPGWYFEQKIPELIKDINKRIEAGDIHGVKNGIYIESGKTYFYKNGKKQKGFQKSGKNTYYFDPSTYAMQTGWLKLGDKKYYLKKKSGILATGWLRIKDKPYFFRKKKSCLGEMVCGRKLKIDGVKRNFDSKGVCTNPPDFKYPTVPFYAKVLVSDLNIRAKASTGSAVNGICPMNTFTITKRSGDFGKLKSGAGWIYLGNTDWVKTSKTL